MAEKTEPRKKSSGLWLKLVLFTSLAINLLIVGMMAGAVLRGGPGDSRTEPHRSAIRDLGLGPFGLALSSESRRDIGSAIAGKGDELRQNRQEIRVQIDTLLTVLRQTPYQPETVREILTVQQHRLFQRQDIGRELLLSNLEEMGPVARAEYADRLEKSLLRIGRRR
jgi:hypothetical protein